MPSAIHHQLRLREQGCLLISFRCCSFCLHRRPDG